MRRSHIELPGRFDPIDAKVMNLIWDKHRKGSGFWAERTPAQTFAKATGILHFDVCGSFSHLEGLGCVILNHVDGDPAAVDWTVQRVALGFETSDKETSPKDRRRS